MVELDLESFRLLTEDLESAPGLVYGERARAARGDLMDLMQWEPALRWAYTGRPVYDPNRVDLRDAAGRALDPAHGFEPDDDPHEMAEYLRVVGYLWVRHVLPPEEVTRLREAGERLRLRAREGRSGVLVGSADERRAGAHAGPPRRPGARDARAPWRTRDSSGCPSSATCRWSTSRDPRTRTA